MAEYRELTLSELVEPPLPVRASVEDGPLEELADSIRKVGVLQPLIVVPCTTAGAGDGEKATTSGAADLPPVLVLYEIVAGHRRYLAAQRAGLARVPCMIYPELGTAKEAVMLHENIYRADLTAAEEGLLYAELIEKYNLTEAALCSLVRQGTEYIYPRLDLVRRDPAVMKAVLDRKVNFSVAKELNRCTEAGHRAYLLHQAIESGVSARVVRAWIDDWKLSKVPAPAPAGEPGAASPGGAPPENTLRCHVCQGEKDPQNLKTIHVHWYELEAFDRMVESAVAQVRS